MSHLNSEEKELKDITERFSNAVKTFTEKDFKSASALFKKIIEDYNNSEHFTVLEVMGRSQVYYKMAAAQLTPDNSQIGSPAEFMNEGVFQYNAGNHEKASELFTKIYAEDSDNPYLNYLLALTNYKLENTDASFDFLRKAVQLDDYYKIVAFNEPDFADLLDDENFVAVVS